MFTTAGLIVRIIFAILLVFGCYNPLGYSYYHWLTGEGGDGAAKLFTGLVLLFLLFIHVQATWRALKLIGVSLLGLVIGSSVWVLNDFAVIDLGDPTVSTLTWLTALAIVLGAGQSWSLVRYRLSGQVDSQNLV